jgi:hypothetical protein
VPGCIAYYRVSTERQGRSGLGLDAQRSAVRDYLRRGNWELIGEYTEVESGKRVNRPQLAAALAECKTRGAILIIAKLDRARSIPILHVGGMDGDVQQEAERVDEDVALATRDFLACVIARRIDRRPLFALPWRSPGVRRLRPASGRRESGGRDGLCGAPSLHRARGFTRARPPSWGLNRRGHCGR